MENYVKNIKVTTFDHNLNEKIQNFLQIFVAGAGL